MADKPPPRVSGEARTTGDGRDAFPGTPRWVTIPAAVLGAVLLVLLVLKLTGLAGEHGPGRHLSGRSSSSDGAAPVPGPSPGASR